MQRSLRPYLAATAVGAAGALIVCTPAPSAVDSSAVQLAAATDLLGDLGSILAPYQDIVTYTFTDLDKIGTELLDTTGPAVSAAVEHVVTDPAALVNVPENLLETLTNLVVIDESGSSVDVTLGMPLALLIGGLSPLLAPVGAVEDIATGLTSGNLSTTLATLVDAPATVVNHVIAGFLRPAFFDVTMSDAQATQLNAGIDQLNPLLAELGIDSHLDPVTEGPATVGGVGGLVDTLLNYVPQQLASAVSGDMPGVAVNPLAWLVDALSHLLSNGAGGLSADLPLDLGAQLTAMPTDLLSLLSL